MDNGQDPRSFGRFERGKNSKLPLFSFGSSKLLGVSVNFTALCQSVGKLASSSSC